MGAHFSSRSFWLCRVSCRSVLNTSYVYKLFLRLHKEKVTEKQLMFSEGFRSLIFFLLSTTFALKIVRMSTKQLVSIELMLEKAVNSGYVALAVNMLTLFSPKIEV